MNNSAPTISMVSTDSNRFIFRQLAMASARAGCGKVKARVAGMISSAPVALMAKGTITSTKENSPKALADRPRTNSKEARKCAPEVATGPETDRP